MRPFSFPIDKLMQSGKGMYNLYLAVVLTIYTDLLSHLIFILTSMDKEDSRPEWARGIPLF